MWEQSHLAQVLLRSLAASVASGQGPTNMQFGNSEREYRPIFSNPSSPRKRVAWPEDDETQAIWQDE